MTEDPLKSLLRGCKGTSVKTWRTNTNNIKTITSPQLSSSVSLPQLDFFRNQPNTSTLTQSQQPQTFENTSKQNDSIISTLDNRLCDLIPQPKLQKSLSNLGITTLKPIQRRVIPLILSSNDVIAIAPTGSGKTLAYLLPLFSQLLSTSQKSHKPCTPFALILAPTKELAEQIGRVINRFKSSSSISIRTTVVTTRAAIAGFQAGVGTMVDIVVGTPLRIAAAVVNSNSLNLSHLKHVILDEADELLDTKFMTQMDSILEKCNKSQNTRIHLFSATLPSRIEDMIKESGLLNNAKKIVVGGGAWGGAAAVTDIANNIEQKFMFVGGRGEQGKVLAVRELLKGGVKTPVLVFVQTKDRAAELFRELVYDGVRVEAVHGDRSGSARSAAVARFRKGQVWVLIATDVLARGLDLISVNSVISYDVPSSAAAYVHRIGRTGRNGRTGTAVTLFTEEDKRVVGPVVKIAKASGADVPDWLIKLADKVRTDEARRLETRPPKRKHVGGDGIKKKRRKRAKKTNK